jgi:hypothetical protein
MREFDTTCVEERVVSNNEPDATHQTSDHDKTDGANLLLVMGLSVDVFSYRELRAIFYTRISQRTQHGHGNIEMLDGISMEMEFVHILFLKGKTSPVVPPISAVWLRWPDRLKGL